MLRRLVFITLLSTLPLLQAESTSAVMINFAFESSGSGDLGGISFADEAFTITLFGDTNNRTAFANGFTILNDMASITFPNLNGGAPIAIATPTTMNVNTNFDGVTFGNEALMFDVLLLFDPALDGYELLDSFPSITGVGFLNGAGTPLQTSEGTLNFVDSEAQVTFSASSVPEPGALAILGICSLGLIARRRRCVMTTT